MARRLIGTGITNSQGIATMNKDPSGETITGYTGVGAGKLQIIAVSGNVQSETYTIYDCIKYDLATTDDHTDFWSAQPNRGTSYSTFDNPLPASESMLRYFIVPQQDICVEFDVYVTLSSTSAYFASIRYGTSGVSMISRDRMGMSNNTWYHIKLEIINGVSTWTNTDTDRTYTANVENYNRFYFRLDIGDYIAFRNVLVYAR